MILAYDASALLALTRNEPGGSSVAGMLDDRANQNYVHAVNLCEVLYDYLKSSDEADALFIVDELLRTRLRLRDDMDRPFWEQIGRYKAAHRIALGDCFGLALTHRLSATFVTADHEIDPIAQGGILPVQFIR